MEKVMMPVPSAVQVAFDHVKSFHPDVTTVSYDVEQGWLYSVAGGRVPEFGAEIDVDILQRAVDELMLLPATFVLTECGVLEASMCEEDGEEHGLNDARAHAADAAVSAFRGMHCCDAEDAVSDLLANLMHLSDRDGTSFQADLVRAERNYSAEASGVAAEFELTPSQKVLLEAYAGGEFAHIANLRSEREVRGMLDQCGDTLFKFLFLETSISEGCLSSEQTVERLEAAIGEISKVLAALEDPLRRSWDNVLWKRTDGTWGIGYFGYFRKGAGYEWEVDFDYTSFYFASVGHATKEAAYAAWDRAFPRDSSVHVELDTDTELFEVMAENYFASRKRSQTEVKP